jgi:hypothetical protein
LLLLNASFLLLLQAFIVAGAFTILKYGLMWQWNYPAHLPQSPQGQKFYQALIFLSYLSYPSFKRAKKLSWHKPVQILCCETFL